MTGDILTTRALCWSIVRNDGQIITGTTLDVDLVVTAAGYAGTYKAFLGIDATNIQSSNDLTVDNLEVKTALESIGIQASDIEAGLYDGASVVVFETDFTDPSAVTLLKTGTIGNITRTYEGANTNEVRGLSQALSQTPVQVISKVCRAELGDSRCKIDMGPLTFSGTVDTVSSQDSFTDAGLDQVGPVVEYVDTTGYRVPQTVPFQITPIVPSGGTWVADSGVTYQDGTPLTAVGGAPATGQYNVVDGVYTFANDASDSGKIVLMPFTYTYGYFDKGKLTWTAGANAGYSMEIRTFTPAAGGAPAQLLLFTPMVNPIQPGDAYNIQPGCDQLLGTCRDRWDNLNNMRAEPYTPGPDVLRLVVNS